MQNFFDYLKWIDNEHNKTLETLKTWVGINSWTENLPGLENMAKCVKTAFRPICDHFEEYDLHPFKRIELKETSVIHLGKALSFSKRMGAKKKVFLGGHIDTVFPPTSPFQTYHQTNADTLIGPGVADMKGGLAILLLGLEAFEKSPFAENIGWEVFINPDEEIGSIGSRNILAKKAAQFDIGVWFEPAFSDGAIVGQRKGSANFTILAKGKAAHVGRDFHLGKNAVTALARFIVRLETLQEKGFTINVGNIHGGGPLNIVPDRALCKINIRFNSMDDLCAFEKEIHEFSTAESRVTEISIDIHKDVFRPPKIVDEKTEMLYLQFKESATTLDQQLFMRPTGGVSDGNILAFAGLPTLDTMGAIGGNIHTHEEYISIESIRQRAKLFALFLMNYAEKGF